MNAQDILKMIEEVDPSDRAKLDEIDARVFKYLIGDEKPDSFWDWKACQPRGLNPSIDDWIKKSKPYKKYTRSRDARRDIRPEGYLSGIFTCGGKWCDQIRGWCQKLGTKQHEAFLSPWNESEEKSVIFDEDLAELHAIFQSIEHERTK